MNLSIPPLIADGGKSCKIELEPAVYGYISKDKSTPEVLAFSINSMASGILPK
jgi:hypothetical protein